MASYIEPAFTKTKIVATLGPASRDREQLRGLMKAGVDVFRLNFAHGKHDILKTVVEEIRELADELRKPVAILGDLAGPKIRLGQLPPEGLELIAGEQYSFVRDEFPEEKTLTTTYPGMIDDLVVGNRILLADGVVSMRVVAREPDRIVCEVEQPGRLFSRQGVNLPSSQLLLSSLTEKDEQDLVFALQHRLDFISLSFVRSAADVRLLRQKIENAQPGYRPLLVSKIEKPEAVEDLENILKETDVIMVARGDLGVEVDIVKVPTIQKNIIRRCNQYRVPVITATQMLETMQKHDLPTRAEVTDVANAVLDGTDAVMLSAETAVGINPVGVVTMMSRIVREIEPLVVSNKELPIGQTSRNTATQLTRGVTLGAIYAAEEIDARLIVVLSRSGKTAFAVSELRSEIPILALTDNIETARSLSIAWGVFSVVTEHCQSELSVVRDFASSWGISEGILKSGDRVVIVGTTDWADSGKNLLIVHAVP